MANCCCSLFTMVFRCDVILWLVMTCVLCVASEESYAGHYTPTWAVHIKGGKEVADAVAAENGFVNLGQIFDDHYHFHHNSVRRRSVDPSHHHHGKLSADARVHWAKQQTLLSRRKRDFIPVSLEPVQYTTTAQMSSANSMETATTISATPRSHEAAETPPMIQGSEAPNRTDRDLFPPYGRRSTKGSGSTGDDRFPLNDHRWPQMWYLNRGGGVDMNVIPAWKEGITGKGVVVTILDDGLEKDHPDLVYNYDPQASYDVNNHDEDPMPRYDLIDSNRHGTRCAGEVAATANNSLCAVGVAFGASVGGVRMLDGDVTDAVEARSLSLNPQHIDIYSASWGPDDDGKTVDGPGELATRAFIEGVTKGRSGKGSIFVWASGNGGRDQDNCNCDGYTNSIWTLSISSATERGEVPWYSEMCSSTLATTYSSGAVVEKQVITTDLHHSCTSSHTGTSASAPLAAGICALALEANRDLTWRDMQHIVVRTAKPANLQTTGWTVNGVGRNVSHSFGYGLMDATAMVQLARTWRTVPAQKRCEVSAPHVDKSIPPKSQVVLQLAVNHCSGVNYLEHVQAKISLTTARRGDLQISLTSPAGTKVVLLAPRVHDTSRAGFNSWPFMSVHTWGESPYGVWLLEIHNQGRYMGRATLQDWALIFYGTTSPADKNDPSPYSNNNRFKVDISQSVLVPSVTIPATKPKTKGNNKSQNNIANQYIVSSNGNTKKNKNGKNQNRNSQGKNKSSIKPTATILRGISNKTTTNKHNGKSPQRQIDSRLPSLNKKSETIAKVTEKPEQDTTLLVGVTKVFKQEKLPKVTKISPYDTTMAFHTVKYQKNMPKPPSPDLSLNLKTGKPSDDFEVLSRTSEYHFTTEETTRLVDVSTNPPNFQGFIFIDQPPDGHVALKNSQMPSLFQKYPKIQHIYPALFPYPKVEVIANKPSRQHPPLSQFHPEYIGGFAPQEALDSDLETDHHVSSISSEDKGTLTQWDMIFYGTQLPAQADYDSIHDLRHNPPLDGSNLAVGDGEPGDHNSLEPESSSRWRDTQRIREDGRFDEHLTSVGEQVASSGCLSFSDHHRCLECSQEYFLYNGVCLIKCPENTYTSRSFLNSVPTKPKQTINKNVEPLTKRYVNRETEKPEAKIKNSQRNVMKPEPPKICLDCHYTCATCIGPYNYQCSSCPEDAKLFNSTSSNVTESYCYPSHLLPRISLSNAWTTRLYVVFAVVTLCLLLTMLFYLIACILRKFNTILCKCCNKDDDNVVVSYNRLGNADETKHSVNIAKEIHSAIYDDTDSDSDSEHERGHP